MKTNVRESSIEAYYSEDLTTERGRILHYMRFCSKGASRRQISNALTIDTATVSGLITPMVKDGDLIEMPDSGKRECPITERKVLWLFHPIHAPGQQRLI